MRLLRLSGIHYPSQQQWMLTNPSRNLKQRQLNVIAELPKCLVYDPDDPADLPLPRGEIRPYDKDLSDPPVETNVVSLRIFIRLTHLQNMFLLERLLLQYGCPDEGDVLLVSYEMITLTLMFWMHKDRFRDIRRDMEWLVSLLSYLSLKRSDISCSLWPLQYRVVVFSAWNSSVQRFRANIPRTVASADQALSSN